MGRLVIMRCAALLAVWAALPVLAAGEEIAQRKETAVRTALEKQGKAGESSTLIASSARASAIVDVKMAGSQGAPEVTIHTDGRPAYEWFKLTGSGLPFAQPDKSPPASKQQLMSFFHAVETELEKVEFFRPPDKRDTMQINLRNIFTRMGLTQQDIRTLHGVITSIAAGRKGPARGGVLDGTQAEMLRALLAREGESAPPDLSRTTQGPMRGLAKLLRRNPTDAERLLWERLTNDNRFATAGFKRQTPVGRHMTDFVSFPLRMVIDLAPADEQAEAAKAVLEELRAQPRKENLDVARAQVEYASANVKNAEDQLDKQKKSFDLNPKSVSKYSLDNAENAVKVARANLEVAQKQYDLTKAGAWSYDIKNQESQYEAFSKAYEASDALLGKYTLKAPVDGVVLSVNATPGSYVSAQGTYDSYTTGFNPVIVLGTDHPFFSVRSYIDEILIHRLPDLKHVKAKMFIRGTNISVPLEFVRVQPYVSPKIQLSDQRTERVDVRVLPIIFKFEKPEDVNLYPGQLVDVYIEEPEEAGNK